MLDTRIPESFTIDTIRLGNCRHTTCLAVSLSPCSGARAIRVVSITEHADDSPTGKVMEAFIESMDEFYSDNLAQEVRRDMREAAAERGT